MRATSRAIVLFLFLLTGSYRLCAQPNTLYFLKGVPQTKDLNPARPGIEKGFYISMPLFSKLDLSVNSNNWSFSDIIHPGSGAQSDSLVWDFKNFLSSIDKNNFVMESTSRTIIEFGLKRGTGFYSFSWTGREFVEPFFTKSLANLLYYGNAPYVGSTYHTGYFGIGAQHYNEFSFTYAKDISKKISVGVTGKLLFGMEGIKTTGISAIGGMPITGDQFDLGATGRAFISAPDKFKLVNTQGYHILTNNYLDSNSFQFDFGNPGFAVDLGFTNKVNKEFEFSMSIIDLGFISWKKDLSTYSENGHFRYQGINLDAPTGSSSNLNKLVSGLEDSLKTTFYPDTTATPFTTLLPVKIYLAGEYRVSEKLTFGGVARIRISNNQIHNSLTASVNAAPSKKLSLSASYSIMESTFDNLGLAASYRLGPVQLYAASDNVLSFLKLTNARNMNLRVGINLIFQDETLQRKGLYHRKVAKSAHGCPL